MEPQWEGVSWEELGDSEEETETDSHENQVPMPHTGIIR